VLIDRSHRTWAWVSAIILVVATLSYVLYAGLSPRGPTGGSFMGLIYGIVGSAMMIFAGLLAGRKQVPFWKLGSAQFWLRGHLWLGTLSVPLILFHAGFGLGGAVEQLLWLFFAIVVLSGFFGLAMQHVLPRVMMARIPRETFKAQVPYIRRRNRVLADRLISTVCGRLQPDDDPLGPELRRLAGFAAELKAREKSAKSVEEKSQIKAAKAEWIAQVTADNLTLFRDLASVAKNEGWVRTEDDFPSLLLDVFDFPGLTPEPAPAAPTAAGTAAAAKPAQAAPAAKPASPLEQMKARQAAAESGSAPVPATDSPKSDSKPLSPLEIMKAKQAAKAVEGAAGPVEEFSDKPLSPLEKVKALQAAKASSGASPAEAPKGETASPADKPLSPLEKVKALQAAKAAAAGGEASKVDAPAEKPLSPLEKVKAMQAAKAAGTESRPLQQVKEPVSEASGPEPAASEPEKPLSPLEKVKAMQAAKAAAGSTAPEGTAANVAPAAETPAGKPLSPLEKVKAMQAAKAGGGEAAPVDKPLSPLEIMKAKQAAKAAEGAPAAPAPTEKPKSPLEMMKAKQAAAAGDKPAAAAPAPAAKPAPAPPAAKKPAAKMPLLRTDELRKFYTGTVRPYLVGNGRNGRLADITESSRAFTQMRATLPVELHDVLSVLETNCEEQRQFAELERIHRWLHWWLAMHIPFSIGLLVLFVVHVLISLRVVPWGFPFRF